MGVNNTIQNFITKAGHDDFARDNLFRVSAIVIPPLGFNLNLQQVDSQLLYCKGGVIPGRTNPVSTVSYMGMDLPYNQSTVKYDGNNSYTLTFFIDRESSIGYEFEMLSRRIFDDSTSMGNWQFPSLESYIQLDMLGFDLERFDGIKFYGVTFAGFENISFETAQGQGKAIEMKAKFTYLYYERESVRVYGNTQQQQSTATNYSIQNALTGAAGANPGIQSNL